MSFFLHPVNQEMLWQTIHKVSIYPQFETAIINRQETSVAIWFKENIRYLYESEKLVSTTKEQLPVVNRMVAQFMVDQMKRYLNGPSSQIPSIEKQQPISLTPNKELSREWIAGQKQDSLNSVFQERQKSYESLLKSPAPTPVTFTEQEVDSPISNMEELIKQHMAERERLEVPPPSSSAVKTSPLAIKISDEKPLHNVQFMSLETDTKEKKVRFEEPNPILEAIVALNKKIDAFSEELAFIKNHIFGEERSSTSEERSSTSEERSSTSEERSSTSEERKESFPPVR